MANQTKSSKSSSSAKSTKASKNTSSTKKPVSDARTSLEKFKMEAASEVGVNLKRGYNGDLTAKQAGSIGGQMVKKMIKSYESKLK